MNTQDKPKDTLQYKPMVKIRFGESGLMRILGGLVYNKIQVHH